MTIYIEILYQIFYLAEIAFFTLFLYFVCVYIPLARKKNIFVFLPDRTFFIYVYFFFTFCFDLLDSGWTVGIAHWDIAQEV